MKEIPVLSNGGVDNIIFLFKSMEQKYLDSTMKEGKFCFNHSIAFNQWEDTDSAQYDKWDAHSAYAITRAVVDPPIDEKTGLPKINEGKQIKATGEIYFQSDFAKKSPICCFRCIRQDELEVIGNDVFFSLGETAERIRKEFGHEAYIIMPAKPFIDLFFSKVDGLTAMKVVYQDYLNEYPFIKLDLKTRMTVEQLFRKDKKYEWQNEYRMVLPPTDEEKVFTYLGSIEDMAVCGDLMELNDKKCIYHFNNAVCED